MAQRSKKNKSGKSRGASRGNIAGDFTAPPKEALAQGRNKAGRQNVGRRNLSNYSAHESEPASPEYLARLFVQHEYACSDTELARFWEYYRLLRKRNAELDLTRIMGIEATVLKHFIDCAIVADKVDLTGAVVDIGSGPGFPGMVLAIRRPEVPLILAESRGKRVKFLTEVREVLQLKNVGIFAKSVRADTTAEELLATLPTTATTGQIGEVVTRAVEVMPPTLTRAKSFIKEAGQVVFMKGPNCGTEITQAQEKFRGVYKMTKDEHYTLPLTKQNRRLVVFTKREKK